MGAQLKPVAAPADTPAATDIGATGGGDLAVRAEKIKLGKRMTVGAAFHDIAASCCKQIDANHAAVGRGDAPEALHQMRVGLRRLRSALRLFGDLVALPVKLREELDWLQRQLGDARDWDVLAASTLPKVADALPDDVELVLVRLAAEARANALRAAAAQAVGSVRYAELMQHLGGWLEHAGWRGHRSPRQRRALDEPASAFAGDALRDSHRRLLKRGRELKDASASTRHRARIAAKQTRYAAEFFQSLYPKKQVRPFVQALTGLQDELGWLNDVAVADGLLKQLEQGEARLDGSAAYTRGYLASIARTDDRKLRQQWRAFKPMALPH